MPLKLEELEVRNAEWDYFPRNIGFIMIYIYIYHMYIYIYHMYIYLYIICIYIYIYTYLHIYHVFICIYIYICTYARYSQPTWDDLYKQLGLDNLEKFPLFFPQQT